MSQKTYEDEALDYILSLQDKKILSKFIIYFFIVLIRLLMPQEIWVVHLWVSAWLTPEAFN